MVSQERFELLCQMLAAFDDGWERVNEYNSLLHDYNGVILYQAQSQFIHVIGQRPGITVTELASVFGKTRSACSQLMSRMKEKGWLSQVRNSENNREYKLYLTEEGQEIYEKHQAFEKACYQRTAQMLEAFSDDELLTYIRVQEKLNEAFRMDVQESRQLKENC